MPNKSKTSHFGRLHILTAEEIQNMFYLPNFTDEERLPHFSLTEAEFEILNQTRSFASKLNFILQLGYFKVRRQFFNFEVSAVSADIEFIRQKYFPDEITEIDSLPKIAVNTLLKHRRTIAKLHNYQFCGRKERKLIENIARNSAKISSKPIFIFREIIHFLEVHRIILPGYSFLQGIVSQSLIAEDQRLKIILQNKLTAADIKRLDELFSDSDELYEITNLKREPKDFTLGEIRCEIERGVKKNFIKPENKFYRFWKSPTKASLTTLHSFHITGSINSSVLIIGQRIFISSVLFINESDDFTIFSSIVCSTGFANIPIKPKNSALKNYPPSI